MFSNAQLIRTEQSDQNVKLHIRLSWNGSWKNDVNFDGIYLFAKYLYRFLFVYLLEFLDIYKT